MKTPDYNLKELPEYDDPVEAQAHRQSCAYPPIEPPVVTPPVTKSPKFGWLGWVCGVLAAAAILIGGIGLARHHYNNPDNQPLAYKNVMRGSYDKAQAGLASGYNGAKAVFDKAKGKMVAGGQSLVAGTRNLVAAPRKVVRKVVRKVQTRPANVVYYFAKSGNGVAENTTLNQVASDAAKANANVTVTGYADPSGSADFNARLSERRAKSVGDYLVKHGVPAKNIKVKGAGETTNYGDAPHNRRAVIHVDYK